MPNVRIVEWEEKYAPAFIALSLEWLARYVSVEPADLEIMNNQRAVIDGGGQIFLALHNDEVVGTVALLKLEAATFELAKLGVTERYKGLKIGRLLMEKGLDFARKHGAGQIILYSNRALTPAIGLYEKFGFVEVPVERKKYIEADMKMALSL